MPDALFPVFRQRLRPLAVACCLSAALPALVGTAVLPAVGAPHPSADSGHRKAGVPLPNTQHPTPARIEYNRDIRPILADKCFACHGPDASHRKANLRLDLPASSPGGGVIVPGKPAESRLLVRLTTHQSRLRMPPATTGKKLSPAEVDLIRRWIGQGAAYQAHWAYVAPRRPAPPVVRNGAWVRNPIDRFILAKLEAAGLKPSPEADPYTLIRRVSLDLTGLPPTPAEVDAFVRESSSSSNSGGDRGRGRGRGRTEPQTPRAYERLVDRLLASPRYGERMAMYWLDLVRYADTVGYHGDQEHAISPYRDWVIKAFIDNMPFDRFTTEQLAGDLLAAPTVDQRIATGYNRMLQTTHEGGAQDREYLAKYSADRVRNLSSVWMGATVGCAECHDHKYDPYTQKDFYSLAAFFADIQERGAYGGPDATPTRREPEIEALSPFDQAEAARIEAEVERLNQQRGKAAGDAASLDREAASLEARLAELRKRKRRTMVTVAVPPRTIRILRRGDWMDEGGAVVTPAAPHFLKPAGGSGRPTRLDLARWLTASDHPQTARVFVNRMWYLLFGAGLSRSLDDFGAQGEPPTHPELLDWLATTFVEGAGFRVQGSGPRRPNPNAQGPTPDAVPPEPRTLNPAPWGVKALLRLIVTSAAYRQSSLNPPALHQRDPENRLLARQGRFRVPAEMIRDNALAVSGLLVERLGGAGARPYQPEGYYALLNFPKRTYQHDSGAGQYRRGVYVHWQRQYLHPMLRAFDAPSREECTAQRPITNTPLAALTLLNDPTFTEAARVLAARILREGGSDDNARIRWAWRLVLSRRASDREAAALARLYQQNRGQYQADPAAAKRLVGVGLAPTAADLPPAELASWTAVSRALLNLNETITRN